MILKYIYDCNIKNAAGCTPRGWGRGTWDASATVVWRHSSRATLQCVHLVIKMRPSIRFCVYLSSNRCVFLINTHHKPYTRLNIAGLGPRYLGRFSNGRVEAFLEGHRTLTHRDLSVCSLVTALG